MKRILLLVGAGLVFASCSKMVVRTEVKADGSWTRDLNFTVASEPMGDAPDPESVFQLPSGKEWKIKKGKKDENVVITAHRSLAKGEKIGDFGLKQKKKKKSSPGEEDSGDATPPKTLLVNEVTVREIAPGTFEYRERLRWKGKREKSDFSLSEFPKKDLAKIRSLLPEKMATDAHMKKIVEAMGEIMVRIVFGPGEPLVPQFLLQTDLAMRRVKVLLGDALMVWLEKNYRDEMNDAVRLRFVRACLDMIDLTGKLDDEMKKAKPMGEKKEEKAKEETDFISMSFVLKFPGTIIETNGLVDRYSGTVYWGVFPPAVSFKDVELRAVFKVR